MGKAKCNGMMAVNMKGITSKEENKDLEDFLLHLVNVMKDHGKMESKMGQEFYSIYMDNKIEEDYGNKENL